MRVAIDANGYRLLCDGDPGVIATLQAAVTVFVPPIVYGELQAGFRNGTRYDRNQYMLDVLPGRAGVSLLMPDASTAVQYGKTYAVLRREGRLIPPSDIWIAASCLQHNLPLLNRDRHFGHVPGLRCV